MSDVLRIALAVILLSFFLPREWRMWLEGQIAPVLSLALPLLTLWLMANAFLRSRRWR